jgi:hypothetical protein
LFCDLTSAQMFCAHEVRLFCLQLWDTFRGSRNIVTYSHLTGYHREHAALWIEINNFSMYTVWLTSAFLPFRLDFCIELIRV